jgi:hypothetical protein
LISQIFSHQDPELDRSRDPRRSKGPRDAI